MSRATNPNLSPPLRPVRSLLRVIGHAPPQLFGAVSRWCPVNADGEHVSVEMLTAAMVTAVLPNADMGGATIGSARAGLERVSALVAEKLPVLAVEEDLEFDGPAGPLPVTRYRAGVDTRGLILFFHGGGFTTGSRASHDALARRLAVDTGADVVSVEYRLAPENPFPAAVDDALAAWRGVVDAAPGWGVPSDRIVVAGDSAGGNLAAVVSQQVRGEEVTPALQLLLYPKVDSVGEYGSIREFGKGYFLTAERIDQFTEVYVPDPAQLADPRVSPLLAEDLSGLPPAHVVVAGFDPLRDEGIAYADALGSAGVPVTLQREGALIHGFANMVGFSPVADQAISRFTSVVSDVLR